MSLYLLMVRNGDKAGRGVITLREGHGGVTKDGIAYGSRLCRLAPDFYADTDWCVVEAPAPAKAKWPDPEPWVAPAPDVEQYPAADDLGAAAAADR